MTNQQAKTKHRTTAQIAELCLQSAEDYHQYGRELPDNEFSTRPIVGRSRRGRGT
jgi:hypothetical protein